MWYGKKPKQDQYFPDLADSALPEWNKILSGDDV